VRIDPLSWCYTEPVCAPPGLILGYANLTESQIDTGVRIIAAAAGRPDVSGTRF
jgi:GntR family transcriptional regulator/MocR family aminotransferase